MPTQPSNENPCEPSLQAERQDFLEELYRRSGRGRKGHQFYGLYTGLYQEMILGDAP